MENKIQLKEEQLKAKLLEGLKGLGKYKVVVRLWENKSYYISVVNSLITDEAYSLVITTLEGEGLKPYWVEREKGRLRIDAKPVEK